MGRRFGDVRDAHWRLHRCVLGAGVESARRRPRRRCAGPERRTDRLPLLHDGAHLGRRHLRRPQRGGARRARTDDPGRPGRDEPVLGQGRPEPRRDHARVLRIRRQGDHRGCPTARRPRRRRTRHPAGVRADRLCRRHPGATGLPRRRCDSPRPDAFPDHPARRRRRDHGARHDPLWCSFGTCPLLIGNVLTRFDPVHVTPEASQASAPALLDLLRKEDILPGVRPSTP